MSKLSHHLYWVGLIVTLSLLWLTGCSLTTNTLDNDSKVELAEGVWITLPTPGSFGGTLVASQLINIQWQQDGQSHSQTLPVQLEVSDEQLAMAGFSSWGSRVLSLTYENGQISTAILPGLDTHLPKPEQVALNLMLTIWPLSAWDKALTHTGWQLKQQGRIRKLLDNTGQTKITIEYSSQDKLAGTIIFKDHTLRLKIIITTLNHGSGHDAK